jgi:hypothetical protein
MRARRFSDLIARQLTLFREDFADLVGECAAAERAYDRAGRDEAEERYAEYLGLVEEGTDALASIRDGYAATLEPEDAAEYETAFNRSVARHLPRFALGIGE